jgi:HAD superfamily hydrolase (TIGR01450 family)
VLDLDGVVWLTGRPIPGSDEAVATLRGSGVRVLFATNNSAPTKAELHRRLQACGITAPDDDLLTSADVAAAMLVPGSTALVVGEDGVVEALAARGVTVVQEGAADAVVVGLDQHLTYGDLARAADAVRAGARLVGTNDDATLPTPSGPVPGAGSILAGVSVASGAQPEIAGKPHPPTADAIRARVQAGQLRAVVGDRPSTDGALAAQLGVPFALVLSGVTPRGGADDLPAGIRPAAVEPDLAALVRTSVARGDHATTPDRGTHHAGDTPESIGRSRVDGI